MKTETLGKYTLQYKSDCCIDILYEEKGEIKKFENFQSVVPSIIQLNFLKEPIIDTDSLILSRNGKYGILYMGQIVLDCIYDEIQVINARTSHDKYGLSDSAPTAVAIWYMLRIGEMQGLFCTSGIKTDVTYEYVDVIDWKTYQSDIDFDSPRYFFLQLDSNYYATDNSMTRICEDNNMSFEGFVSSYQLVFCDINGNFDFYNLHTGDRLDIYAYDYFGEKLDAYDPDNLKLIEYAIGSWAGMLVDLKNEKYVYSPSTNTIILNPYYEEPKDEEDEHYRRERDDDYIDDTDYERETFDALGGYDYDEWKERGGDIDSMMDGMGF
jgi:hypothetical protein